MRSEKEREQGRRFSELLRQRYEASRFRAGIEWLEGSADEESRPRRQGRRRRFSDEPEE